MDTDQWPDTLASDWAADTRVQFDPDNPAKTIPLSWAQDFLQRQYKRNPAAFGNKLAEVVADWSTGKYGSDEK